MPWTSLSFLRFHQQIPEKLVFQTAGIGSDYAEYLAKHIYAEL